MMCFHKGPLVNLGYREHSMLVGWSVGRLVGRSSGVNFHSMQMSLVMTRRFISSGGIDGAPFWSRFGFVTLHAQPCACH